MLTKTVNGSYALLKKRVREAFLVGQQRIEEAKVRTYWKTGQLIHQHILENNGRAEYSQHVIERLSRDLNVSASNLRRTVQFFRCFPISAALRKLSWQHYITLIPIEDTKQREDFARRAEKHQWTYRELERKIRQEVRDEKVNGRKLLTSSVMDPIHAKRGLLYTYRIIRPETVHPDDQTIYVDLGFMVYKELTPDLSRSLKVGDIVKTERNRSGSYHVSKTQQNEADLFTYRALVERVIDGDTLRVKIDLGFGTWVRQYLRLRGLDAAERNTAAGRRALAFVKRELSSASSIVLRSTRSDKYDRYLSDVFYEKQGKLLFLNNELLAKGFAVRVY